MVDEDEASTDSDDSRYSSAFDDDVSDEPETEEEPAVDAGTLPQVPQGIRPSLLFTKLVLRWSHPSYKPSRAIMLGERNEANVIRELKLCRAVKNIGHIGLLQSVKEGLSHVAATPDAIADVILSSGLTVSVCVEIRTHCAATEFQRMSDIHRAFEVVRYTRERRSFYSVEAGSSEFHRIVQHKHHVVQMIARAVVTGLRDVLYVVASQARIVFAVVISFPEAICSAFESILRQAGPALAPFRSLYTGDDIHAPDTGKTIMNLARQLHGEHVSREILAIVESRLPKALALRRAFWNSPISPLTPARRIKPAVTMLYNSLKRGVDKWSKFAVKVHVGVGAEEYDGIVVCMAFIIGSDNKCLHRNQNGGSIL